MNRNRPPAAALLVACAVLSTASCDPPDPTRGERLVGSYLRLIEAEDLRPDSGRALTTLLDASRSGVGLMRRTAVRALGRLEDPDLRPRIEPLLSDPVPAVREQAAHALAQAYHGRNGDEIVDVLIRHAETESDPAVLAAVARSVGRSASTPGTRARASAALVALSRAHDEPGADAPLRTMVGVALGFESMVRAAEGRGLGGGAAARLQQLTEYGRTSLDPNTARLRSLAFSTLAQARRMDLDLASRMLRDPSPSARLLAARHVDAVAPTHRRELLRRLIGDESPQVVIEAIRAIARQPRDRQLCAYLLAAADPRPAPPIRVPAIDALATRCPQIEEQRAALTSIAASIDVSAEAWHAPAHALVSLTAIDSDAARGLLPRFVGHADPFVRAYAARAAGALADREALRALVADADPNVRTAALQALFALDGHLIDETLVGQLDDDDPQLLLTVARLLEGSPLGDTAARAALDALDRISRVRRETWRDPRRALLARAAELGDESLAGRLRPYLTDYDPVVAEDAAVLLSEWTGRIEVAAPVREPPLPLPDVADFREIIEAQVVLHMRSGGSIVIELHPAEAATNVHRFVRLAESGYFDGLTFHRWAPNFVIQGGSPGANEYAGDGPFTRDEIGLRPHWRGSVGISTRGRDTGDGQIFVNLDDNPRLNHDYTIVGTVVEGMDVVDSVLEGAVIERAEVRTGS